MIAYDESYASLYDLFYGNKPYGNEVAFLDDILRKHASGPSDRLLDVACGTGQHARRFADAGWEVVGVDRSPSMLTAARERANGRPIEFVEQDMAAMDLPGPAFDAAVCLFDSIGYGVTNEAISRTLSSIRIHLRAHGLVAIEFWHAPAMLRSYEPIRERQWRFGAGSIRRTSRTTLDIPRQVARVEYEIEHRNASDVVTKQSTEIHENRFFLVQEMALFLTGAGFAPVDWFAGYDSVAAINEATWHVLVLAKA